MSVFRHEDDVRDWLCAEAQFEGQDAADCAKSLWHYKICSLDRLQALEATTLANALGGDLQARIDAEVIKAAAGKKAKAAQGPYLVTLAKNNTKKQQQHQVRFREKPSWKDIQDAIEERFRDLRAEDYQVEDDDRLPVSETSWAALESSLERGTELKLKVCSLAKGFSDFDAQDVPELLGLASPAPARDEGEFPARTFELDKPLAKGIQDAFGLKTVGEYLVHVGRELASRYWQKEVDRDSEMSRRVVMDPVLHAAAVLAGDIQVVVEWSAVGERAKGSIDYAFLFENFAVVVVEAKLNEDLQKYVGQLAAEMRTAREVYKRTQLGYKRKRDDDEDEIAEVPSFGILSNGTCYRLYKFLPKNKQLFTCKTMDVPLRANITAEDAADAVKPVLSRLVALLEAQKDAMAEAKAKAAKRPKGTGGA